MVHAGADHRQSQSPGWSLRFACLACGALLCCFAALPLHAGLDIDAYLPPTEPIADEGEAARVRERVARELEAARLATERAEQEARLEQERIARELAARPLPVRLLDQRCIGCHDMQLILQKPRTRLGWEWVILRMQWLNGAELDRAERGIIASHLSAAHGAPRRRAIIEGAALAAIAGVALYALFRRLRLQRTDRQSEDRP